MIINVPKYKVGDNVYVVDSHGSFELYKVLDITIHVEDNDVYYHVSKYNKPEVKRIVNEEELMCSNDYIPTPAHSTGDLIHYNYYEDKLQVWEARSGIIEKIVIEIDETGYAIYYKTDEHTDGDFVNEDDVIANDFVFEKQEEEKDVI